MLLDGQAGRIDDHIPRLYKSAFFQDRMLVMDDIIYADLFVIVEGADTPAEA